MRIVLDTNIYLASLLSEDLCFKLIELTMGPESEHLIFISDEIWKEMQKIIIKKNLVENSRLPGLEGRLRDRGLWVEPAEKIDAVSRDKDDNKILECAVAANADIIISMDKDLLKLKNFRNIGIVHPKTFVYMIGIEKS